MYEYHCHLFERANNLLSSYAKTLCIICIKKLTADIALSLEIKDAKLELFYNRLSNHYN